MLESGNDLIKKYFNFEESEVVFEGDHSETPSIDQSEDSTEEDFVTLPDGTKARLKIKGDIL